jgi:ADP-ribose pyrophosphatase YjhB (NUDIX family)
MIIRNGERILLIERRKSPFGFAPSAGHIDGKGSYENAAKEEVLEEVGLTPTKISLIKEGRKENPCRRECGTWHYWKIFEVETAEALKRSLDETKQAGRFSHDQIADLAKRSKDYLESKISQVDWEKSPGLEPVWLEWFNGLGLLSY